MKIKDSASFFTVPIYELILCDSKPEAKVDAKLSSKCFVYTINITIGVMFVILFMMLMAVHIVWVSCMAKQICNQCTKLDCVFFILITFVAIAITVYVIICPIWCCIKKWCRCIVNKLCMKFNEKKESEGNKKTTTQESGEKTESNGNEKISKKNQNNSNILREISMKVFIISTLIIICLYT